MRAKLAAGAVRDVDDLITLNVDIRQFAQDVIENCEGPELLRAFWHAIERITILDPTCGSGAFLFAALSILEPLYDACLERMEAFLKDLERFGEKHRPEKYTDFRQVLASVAAHPNRRYFILKNIILNNLFGVDIMEEAVEICKLRLFLKLAAQVEPDATADNTGIEPLPDIDFNIRAGNTLVGYSSYEAVKAAIKSKFDLDNVMEKIASKAAALQQTFNAFRQRQIEGDGSVHIEQKNELRRRLNALKAELDRHLAIEYGIKVAKTAYGAWLKSHQPFHWFVEFYRTMRDGGFDVVIGNPPYLETVKLRGSYQIKSFETLASGNLYAICSERGVGLVKATGFVSFIVPLSMFATPNMRAAQSFMLRENDRLWVSFYSNRPDQLFEGAQNFLCIFVGQRRQRPANQHLAARLCTTSLRRWASEERAALFQLQSFTVIDREVQLPTYAYPKFGATIENAIARKILRNAQKLSDLCRDSGPRTRWFVYCYGGVYWAKARTFNSPVKKNGVRTQSTADRPAYTSEELNPLSAVCLLNSSTHFWFWVNFSDCRNKTYSVMLDIPIVRSKLVSEDALGNIGTQLMNSYRSNAERRVRDGRGGRTEFDEFYPKRSKNIIDDIDRILAREYGLAEEELDFIINYDIKYRLGTNSEAEEDE